MKALLEKLVGVNFRTSLAGMVETGIIVATAILMLPAEIWNDWRAVSLAILAILSKTVKDFQTKDKAVSGNAAEGYSVAQKDGTAVELPPKQAIEPPKL